MQPPTLTQYDQWGRRIDKLQTSEGWRKMKEIVVREGLVAIPHERKHGEYSRIHAFAKYFIMSGDSQVVSASSQALYAGLNWIRLCVRTA